MFVSLLKLMQRKELRILLGFMVWKVQLAFGDSSSFRRTSQEFGYGLLGEGVGAIGLGYAAYSTLNKTSPDGATDKNLLLYVAPLATIGAVYGSAAGVTLGGAEVGDNGSFWGASNGAWLGALAAGGVIYAANTSFTGGIREQPYLMFAAISLPPIGAIWGYRKKFGAHSSLQIEPMLYAAADYQLSIAPGVKYIW